MAQEATFSFRDRVKVACLQRCIAAGLDENQMVSVFQQATRQIRSGATKQAGVLRSIASGIGSLASVGAAGAGPVASTTGMLLALGIPVAALGSAALGNIAGRATKNIEVGRLPGTDEIKTLDEIAAYNRTAEEIHARLAESEEEKKRKAKPSVRRMF